MAKVNTLFTYFTKKPSPKTGNKSEQKRSEVLSARKNDNKISDVKTGADVKSSCSFQLHDIVWAKLEGYPWWPSIVANHPKTNNHTKEDRKQNYIHVQFFDDPPSRAWVKEKFVKPYRGSDSKEFQKGGQFYSLNPKCQKAAAEADKAMKMDQKNRSSLIVVMESSDEDEDMDVDDDEEELSSSKENTESPKKETSEMKSPKKRTRDSGCRSAQSKPNKRRRIVIPSDSEEEDDESGDEFKPPASDDDDEDDDDVSSGVDEDEVSDVEESSEPETPVKKQKCSAPANSSTKSSEKWEGFLTPTSVKRTSQKKTLTPSVSDKTKAKLSLFSAPEEAVAGNSSSEERTFPHLSYDFLQPNKIKDRDGNPKGSPDYSPHTLYVPESFLIKQTPAMRQWWEMKSRHFDTILFFKMGKFYELFHMDAVIAVNEMGLLYMKGEYAHSGFPEISFGRYAECLIQKGYKVARIEQTETPDMMTERCKQMAKPTKFDRVVRREICSIQTKGTKRYSFIDGDSSDSSNAYLLAICERVGSEPGSGQTYGVCFVDTSIGKFYIGQFEDDRHSSRLRTLIAHYPPVQVLTERGKLSESTQTLLSNLPSAIHETLRSGTEFWDGTKTLKTLSESDYFKHEDDPNAKPEWPKALSSMLAPDDALGHTPAAGYEMAVRALGAIIWYLRYSLMDEELLSMKNFETYIPVDADLSKSENGDTLPEFLSGRHKMVLDDVTLANLDVLVNSNTGTTEGTLLDRLDNCCTPFGKRLLKQWLCAPLCNPDSINDRLNAVEDLQTIPDVIADVTNILKKMPDLDRLLNKIHTLGSSRRSKNHPDGRAIFFEDLVYSKRKIEDFLSALNGFQMSVDVIKLFNGKMDDFKSHLLKQIVTVAGTDGGKFPDLTEELAFFTNAFDHKKAKAEGVIKPSPGVDKEYDMAIEDIQTAKRELQEYLDAQKKRTGCRSIVYWGTARNRFQLEIPDSVRHVPDEYELTSSKKGFKRYKTAEIERMFANLTDAEERRDSALKDVMRRIFHNFDKSYVQWSSAVQCMSVLDVLINLSKYSQGGDGSMCRPQCVMPSSGTQPYLILREARHPCISRTYTGGDFIPNDTVIGIKDDQDEDDLSDEQQLGHSSLVLVTGPNMGGKSTLMRQVGIITIMAQLGCYVPAEKCELTPVDRVFTRLGATDRIMAGESTFFVELSETSCILRHATKHSLVLLDELGRGTATYDGTAIACAVVHELSENVHCRTLFSTHYHSLVELFSHDPKVRLGHMACMVENENEEDPTQETITFLYKFVKGACPKSYGFSAARLADIPDEVISVAHKKAKEFQRSQDKLRLIRSLYQTESCALEKLRELQELIS